MCGIVAYIGEGKVADLLIDCLKKLEYRGYDSAGISVRTTFGIETIKRKGKISELEKDKKSKQIRGARFGIAHTRWATHGAPSGKNSHPHVDCKNEISIVHNGIIENYASLKEMLKKKGHIFVSDTDSEVISHLVEDFYDGDLKEAVIKSLELVEGAFGLIVMHKDEDFMVAARKGSPLIIGVGSGEMFIASDVPAILNYTKNIIYLQDDDVAVIYKNKYSVENLNNSSIERKIHEVKYTVDQIEKGNFKHFMLKEIFEQPEAIRNILRGRIRGGKIKLTIDFRVEEIKRIIIVACGTSWHSALIGKYLIEEISRIPVEVDYASEFRYRNPLVGEDDLVVVISQSGETADTLAALKYAKEKNAKTLGLINVVGSTISREVDCGIYLHAGPEIGVASTKAFTCQVVALILFSLWLKQEKGFLLCKDFLKEMISLPDKIEETLNVCNSVKKIALEFVDSKNFLYLGRGLNFPVALEGALKLKEISYIHAEGYPAAEMKHGPIALIDENMPVVFVATKDKLAKKVLSNMQEVKTRDGVVIAIVNNKIDEIKKLAKYIIKVPDCSNELKPVINTIPLQLLAYYIADAKGINVDKPRNLAKSVTVE